MKPISMQFCAIPRISNCFLFRNFSAIARNEMAQAEATIARNSGQLRAKEFLLETLVCKNPLCLMLGLIYYNLKT